MPQNRFYSSTTKRTATTVDPGTAGTTLTVTDSTVFSSLDGSFPYALAINTDAADREIVYVTARPTATTLTVTRGRDGTAGQAHAVGATVDHIAIAADLNEAGAHVGASAGVHGVTGSVVGTTDTQTLMGKTLSGATLSGAVTLGSTNIAGAWTSYTPTWTSTTSPTLGATTLNGAYLLVGKTCFMSATITVGTGFAAGSGTYLFGLPFTSATFSPAVNYVGSARFAQGANRWIGHVALGNNSNVVNITTPTSATNAAGVNISATTPAAPVSGDVISWSLVYQVV